MAKMFFEKYFQKNLKNIHLSRLEENFIYGHTGLAQLILRSKTKILSEIFIFTSIMPVQCTTLSKFICKHLLLLLI